MEFHSSTRWTEMLHIVLLQTQHAHLTTGATSVKAEKLPFVVLKVNYKFLLKEKEGISSLHYRRYLFLHWLKASFSGSEPDYSQMGSNPITYSLNPASLPLPGPFFFNNPINAYNEIPLISSILSDPESLIIQSQMLTESSFNNYPANFHPYSQPALETSLFHNSERRMSYNPHNSSPKNGLLRLNDHTSCLLPLSRGNGIAKLPRFYYNFRSRSCEQFIYTGRGGNQVKTYDQLNRLHKVVHSSFCLWIFFEQISICNMLLIIFVTKSEGNAIPVDRMNIKLFLIWANSRRLNRINLWVFFSRTIFWRRWLARKNVQF